MEDKKVKPFNLLYKSDVQLTFIDKLYDIVLGPVRLVVILVMAVILVVFAFRFSLDARLNDLVKESQILSSRWQKAVAPNLSQYTETQDTINSLRNYIELYGTDNSTASTNSSKKKLLKVGSVLAQIKRIENDFINKITILNYSIFIDREQRVRLSGKAGTFADIDNFVNALRSIEYVNDVSIPSQTTEKGSEPKFTIEVLLKQTI